MEAGSEAELRWPRLLFIGDSLTEQGFAQPSGWLARLADRTQRRCDVVGRGFSGYNSRWWRLLAPRLLTDTTLRGCELCGVFLGCNDSCGSGHRLHVPLDEFRDNVSCIVRHLKARGLTSRQILIINVPPVNEAVCSTEFSKSLADCLEFSRALGEAADEAGVSLVDVCGQFLARQNWQQLLSPDGVHFSKLGSEALFDCLWPEVSQRISHLPMMLPDYRVVMEAGDWRLCLQTWGPENN